MIPTNHFRDRKRLYGLNERELDDLRRLLAIVGPLPRAIFNDILGPGTPEERNSALVRHKGLVSRRIKRLLQDRGAVNRWNLEDDDELLSHCVLIVRPWDEEKRKFIGSGSISKRMVASAWVSETILKLSAQYAKDEMQSHIAVLRAFQANSTIGTIFEEFVHGRFTWLLQRTAHHLPPLSPVSGMQSRPPLKLPSNITDFHPFPSYNELRRFIENEVKEGREAALYKMYHRPESKIATAIDAFILADFGHEKLLVFLQMTGAKYHDVKVKGLVDVLNSLPTGILRTLSGFAFIFVVPKRSEFRATATPITMLKASDAQSVTYTVYKKQLASMPQYVMEFFSPDMAASWMKPLTN